MAHTCTNCNGPYPNKSTTLCYKCMEERGMITKNPCGEIPLPDYELPISSPDPQSVAGTPRTTLPWTQTLGKPQTVKIAKNPHYQSMPSMYPTLGTRGKPLSADDMDYLKKTYADLDQLGKSTARSPRVVEIQKINTTRPCMFSDAMDPHCTVRSTVMINSECLCDKHGQVRVYEYVYKLINGEEGDHNILFQR